MQVSRNSLITVINYASRDPRVSVVGGMTNKRPTCNILIDIRLTLEIGF